MSEAVTTTAAVQTPRARVLSSGSALPGLLGASVTTNSYYHASSYGVSFATSAQPGAWWDVQPPWVLDVQYSLDGASFTTLITGEVDQVEFDPEARMVHLTGRDFIAAMIESKTQETFQNQTASQIVQTIAARHGLSTSVAATNVPANAYLSSPPSPTTSAAPGGPSYQNYQKAAQALIAANPTQVPTVAATTELAGTFYQQDHTRTSMGQFSRVQTEWDLLTYLAQQEGYDLWVQGRTLYFQPARAPGSPDFTVMFQAGSTPTANVQGLTLSRTMTLAKDVEVDVISWNSRTARAITRKARAIGAKSPAAQPSSNQVGVSTQRYVFKRPNLTGDQAQQLAQNMLEQITRHERDVTVEMVGELTLSARSQIAISGTGTSFDQTYWVDSIERRMDFQSGFRQTLRLKNHSTLSQVAFT